MPSAQWRRIAILALAAAVMAVPSSHAAEDRPAGAQAAADAGLTDSLGLLEAWVEAQRAYLDIPGISMAVVHGKDVIWSKGFGLANREAKLAATPDTLYSICSISKLFTSLGVLQMRDEGKLALDEPIATYLPWFDSASSSTPTARPSRCAASSRIRRVCRASRRSPTGPVRTSRSRRATR